MRLLLDTHVIWWYMREPARIPVATLELLKSSRGQLYASIVSVWEIALKNSIGKLQLPLPYDELFPGALRRAGVRLLPLQPEHVSVVRTLDWHHKDPFDRMLVAQAQAESMSIVSADQYFRRYNPPVIW